LTARLATTTIGEMDLPGWTYAVLTTIAATLMAVPASAATGVEGDGGPATAAELVLPSDVATLADGSVLIADTGHGRIRLVDRAGIITSVAGGGAATTGPVAAGEIELVRPTGLAVDPAGGFLIADAAANRVWRISAAGTASVIGGTGERGFSGDGGPATAAQFAKPTGIAVDPGGAVLIADQENDRIRRIGTDGRITTVAGGGTDASDIAVFAKLDRPSGVTALPTGGFLIADTGNHRIAQVAYGILTTVAGTGFPGLSADNGRATAITLGAPLDVATTPGGGFVFADQDNQQVRRVSAQGVITTAAGTGDVGVSRSVTPADAVDLSWPGGVATAPEGGLVIANTAANVVLARNSDGTTRVLAGKPTQATKGPAVRSGGGLHLYIVPTVMRIRRGCQLKVTYQVNRDGRGQLKLAATRRSSGTVRYPGGTFPGGTVDLRPGTYRFSLRASDYAGGPPRSASGKLVVLKQRCRG
jgi:DNA-binding beta-propeller fold protein YncE